MRIFEVLGVGSLLITRQSDTIKDWDEFLVTYVDEEDCARKIMYYLSRENQAQKIAKAGQKHVLENYNYKTLMKTLGDELKQTYDEKFVSSSSQG
jgi:spore maturation protein CgeB